MSEKTYAGVYRLAVREARRVEEARSEAWRRQMANRDRAAVLSGEIPVSMAVWLSTEERSQLDLQLRKPKRGKAGKRS